MAAARDPKHVIADELRERIQAGELAPGELVPGEKQLAQDYGVAAMTAQAALGILKSEGLLVARRGSGTRVRDARPIRRRAVSRLSRDVWQAGRSVWEEEADGRQVAADQVVVNEQEASRVIARVLGLPEGAPVCVRSRRYSLDGRPVLLSTSYLSAKLVEGTAITQTDTGPGGTYARLAEIGHGPTRFTEEMRARMPQQDEASRLELPVGSPVIDLARTAFAGDQAVELNRMVLDANAYILEYGFDA